MGEADPSLSIMEDCPDAIGMKHFWWGRGRGRSYKPFPAFSPTEAPSLINPYNSPRKAVPPSCLSPDLRLREVQ